MSDRIWTYANAKREEFDGCCVVCGKPGAELAHIIGRACDKLWPLRYHEFPEHDVQSWAKKPWIVHPDRVTLLCGPPTDTGTDHHEYDQHRLDLLPYLTMEEQLQAVADAGGLSLAIKRVAPTIQAAAVKARLDRLPSNRMTPLDVRGLP